MPAVNPNFLKQKRDALARLDQLRSGLSGPGAEDAVWRQFVSESPDNLLAREFSATRPPLPTPMPDPDDPLRQARQRQSVTRRRRGSGRLSTILSGYEETLG